MSSVMATPQRVPGVCLRRVICIPGPYGNLCSAGATHSVLNEAIFVYMNEIGQGHHEDTVRVFFKSRVGDIGNLLPHVMKIARKSAYELGRNLSTVLPEANRIILVSFQM